jgi:hypothetical protein
MARKEDSRVTKRVNSQMDLTSRGIFNFPNQPKNMLWYLVHKFLFKGLGITRLETWDNLLKRYVADPAHGIPQTPEHRTSARGNLTNQVFSEDKGMSISTYVKAAVVAGIDEIELITIWKKGNRRIVGKVRYPLTPDVLLSLAEEDKKTEVIELINDYLQSDEIDSAEILKNMMTRLIHLRSQLEMNPDSISETDLHAIEKDFEASGLGLLLKRLLGSKKKKGQNGEGHD